MVVSSTPTPGPIRQQQRVSEMPLEDRFVIVLNRTGPLLPAEIQEEFMQMISPTAILMIAGTLAVWAGSHYFGVGFIADAVMLVAGFAFLGLQVFTAASDLISAIELTTTARNQSDLDQAARHLANFIAVVGVAIFTALVMKGAKKAAPKVKKAIPLSRGATIKLSGMTPAHFEVFERIAKQENLIIAVRNTNPRSTPLIARRFPAKPMAIKAKTSKTTGIVTIENGLYTENFGDVVRLKHKTVDGQKHLKAALDNGYAVVDQFGVPRTKNGKILELSDNPGWDYEPGQIIDIRQKKPLVGDYDLLGVIDPENPSRNLALAVDNKVLLENWTNPQTKRVAATINGQMDQPRVMHGGHDQYSGARLDLSDADGSTVFMPNGEIIPLRTGADVTAFYNGINRRGLAVGKEIPSGDPNFTPYIVPDLN